MHDDPGLLCSAKDIWEVLWSSCSGMVHLLVFKWLSIKERQCININDDSYTWLVKVWNNSTQKMSKQDKNKQKTKQKQTIMVHFWKSHWKKKRDDYRYENFKEISWFQEILCPILLIFRMLRHFFRKHPKDLFACLTKLIVIVLYFIFAEILSAKEGVCGTVWDHLPRTVFHLS